MKILRWILRKLGLEEEIKKEVFKETFDNIEDIIEADLRNKLKNVDLFNPKDKKRKKLRRTHVRLNFQIWDRKYLYFHVDKQKLIHHLKNQGGYSKITSKELSKCIEWSIKKNPVTPPKLVESQSYIFQGNNLCNTNNS